MTIPFPLLFGRRLVLCLDLRPAQPTPRIRLRRAPRPPATLDATDAELVRLSEGSFPIADRTRWEAQATFYGFRHH